MMKRDARTITFFYSDGVEKQTAEPIARDAEKRGYKVKFTDNLLEKADIGVYCQHVSFPENSNFSVTMLHDLGQGHNRWPNIWKGEPWDQFDIGILPGPLWAQRWQSCCDHPYTRPEKGVYELGWPKADSLFTDDSKVQKLRESLDLQHEVTVLYAPSWENNGKQDEFVQALKDLPVNLLLKQAPWSDAYSHILDNIEEMDKLHRNYKENVHVIDRNVGIFDCIALSDVIVSEESSVLIEALLLDVPGISAIDWTIPDCQPPRLADVPFDFVIKTMKKDLRKSVEDVLGNIESHIEKLQALKKDNFSYLGSSSEKIMDVIDHHILGSKTDCKPIEAIKPLKLVSRKEQMSRLSNTIRLRDHFATA